MYESCEENKEPSIDIFTNFLPSDIYQEIFNISRNLSWLPWKKLDKKYSTHFHLPIIDEKNSLEINKINKPYNFIFKEIKKIYKKTYQPHNLYYNHCKHGDEVGVHTDRNTNKKNKTFILYLTDFWDADYHGETMFYNKEKNRILAGSMPFPNSAVIFDSNIPHSVSPISKLVCLDRIVLVSQMEAI